MEIYFTYDYELYFGNTTGSVQKCMIEPTNRLIEIANNYNAKITLFVDAGFLCKLKEYSNANATLLEDFNLIGQQLFQACKDGHSIQLHIHPHWENSNYQNGSWKINTDKYKLSDFSFDEANGIVKKYYETLQQLIPKKITAYRAGGWCAQPFDQIDKTFKTLGITIDSSVYVGGKNNISPYQYDYTLAPNKEKYNFNTDICKEEKNGFFTEYPIAPKKYSFIFYWQLYILGKLLPQKHKPIGNGKPISQIGYLKKVLTKGYDFCVCSDGFYASKIQTHLVSSIKKDIKILVIIGHPKAQSLFSLKNTEMLFKKYSTTHQFLGLK